jgi:hypothetical protein
LSYLRGILETATALRIAGATAPIFVAQATTCGGPRSDVIRRAQWDAADQQLGILHGPDTDAIGPTLRSDLCHMAHDGTNVHASLWAHVIARYRATMSKSLASFGVPSR